MKEKTPGGVVLLVSRKQLLESGCSLYLSESYALSVSLFILALSLPSHDLFLCSFIVSDPPKFGFPWSSIASRIPI